MQQSRLPVEIRPASAGDADAIRMCARAAYAQYVQAIGREPAPMVADFHQDIADQKVWVAEIDARLAGFIVFFEQDDAMFLENVAVHPDHTGRGVGSALIRFCERAAVAARLSAIVLYTNEKMIENLSLYPRMGYRKTERRHEDGFHRVYFEKRL